MGWHAVVGVGGNTGGATARALMRRGRRGGGPGGRRIAGDRVRRRRCRLRAEPARLRDAGHLRPGRGALAEWPAALAASHFSPRTIESWVEMFRAFKAGAIDFERAGSPPLRGRVSLGDAVAAIVRGM